MAVDAKEWTFEQEITILDKPALFTNQRLDRETIPKGLYAYDLRHGDEGVPCTVERNVVVNHFGTILMAEDLELGESGCIELGEDDYSFSPIDEEPMYCGAIIRNEKGGKMQKFVLPEKLRQRVSDMTYLGTKITVVIYIYGQDEWHISVEWLEDFRPLLKEVRFERPEPRHREQECHTAKQFMEKYLPLKRPHCVKRKGKEQPEVR